MTGFSSSSTSSEDSGPLPGRLLGVSFVVAVAGILLWFLFFFPSHRRVEAVPVPGSYDPVNDRPNEEGDTGQLSYDLYCSGCHGVAGDGKGPAATFLSPKPRDFTRGIFKFTSTPSGAPPLDDDLLRTITLGLHGTSMPAWRLLSRSERHSLVRYVRSFNKEYDPSLEVAAVPFHENPFDMTDRTSIEESLTKGEEVYHKVATCWGCHPSYITPERFQEWVGNPPREDWQRSLGKPDAWGETILPPDFKRDPLKSVRVLRDLYQVITAGVGGTAMPTWKSALKPEQLWSLTLYVDSLRPTSIVQQTLKRLKEAENK